MYKNLYFVKFLLKCLLGSFFALELRRPVWQGLWERGASFQRNLPEDKLAGLGKFPEPEGKVILSCANIKLMIW
jgi:hypothetical protein